MQQQKYKYDPPHMLFQVMYKIIFNLKEIWCIFFNDCVFILKLNIKFSDEENVIDDIVMVELEENDVDGRAVEQGRNLRRDRIAQQYFS